MTHNLSEVLERSVNTLLTDSLTIERTLTGFDSCALSELQLKFYKLSLNMFKLNPTLSDL
tara:strand:+ start:611 stop:790 length:180 start_codon:yes stop_codon:yes gene_type:complete